jgi:MFS transporter, Spinster family, sphingosine-1-phosphate transporter
MQLPTAQQLASRNERKPLWPIASLCVLTGLNLLDYIDRSLLSSVLALIQPALGIADDQAGAIGTAFMLGYFLTSPLFGYLGDRMPRRWLIAAGVFVWSLGTLFSGHAHGFVSLLCFRALVGFGEASFGTISPGWIADLFRPAQRNNAISAFYVAIPVGSALGYILGGSIAAHWGWRAAFYGAGYVGLALAFVLFLLREPPRGASELGGVAEAAQPVGWRAYLELLKFPRYVLVVAGYIPQAFAMGGFQIWAPSFLIRVHHMELEAADHYFGLSVVVAGLLATVVGGYAATRWQRRTGTGYAWVLALSATAAAPTAFAAFMLPNLALAKMALTASVFLLFLTTGPLNTLILETVPVTMRAAAVAMSIFCIHLFGDLWSPTIVGVLSVRWNNDLQRAVLWTLPGALVVSAFFWCWLVARTRREIARVNAAAIPRVVSA